MAILVFKGHQATPPTNVPSPTPQNDSPRIVSTKPDPLDGALVSASEVIEINFNRPLENVPELKIRVDPKIDLKVELTTDKKTAKIIPIKDYELGALYTLFILPDSKFEGGGKLGVEKIFHFHTIRYRGV